jgi:hypothetical protein
MSVIHPFPARMASEITDRALDRLPPHSVVLDPMCGSGTTLRSAAERGLTAIGVDIDPLATLMAKVWSHPLHPSRLLHDANLIVERASALSSRPQLSWHDAETERFVEYWFAARQREQLTRLAMVLRTSRVSSRNALMVCLSRIIITKDRGASLARDASHSRPHKSWQDNDYDVYEGFLRSCRTVAARLRPEALRSTVQIIRGDCRRLSFLGENQIDCAITSPPYLNALDYMRGHRLSLVWLGFSVADTRSIRRISIGAERNLRDGQKISQYLSSVAGNTSLSDRMVGWIRRFHCDSVLTIRELRRVVRPGGAVVLVVGNSVLRGCAVDNASMLADIMENHGIRVSDRTERAIPAPRRYLPIDAGESALSSRMRSEVVLTGTVESD